MMVAPPWLKYALLAYIFNCDNFKIFSKSWLQFVHALQTEVYTLLSLFNNYLK